MRQDKLKMEILALIPARGGSKSIHMKNIVQFCGKPLVAYSIEIAKKSRYISRVIVSTDSDRIRQVSLSFGAEVPFLRPDALAGDDITDWPVFHHALQQLRQAENYNPDIIVHLRPTTPLRKAEKVDEAIKLLIDHPGADSVRSVSSPVQNPFKMWTLAQPYLKPLIGIGVAESYNLPRQQLPEVLWQNGYVDVTRSRTVLDKKSMTGEKILPYNMDDISVIDIDQPFSLKLAEFLAEHDKY